MSTSDHINDIYALSGRMYTLAAKLGELHTGMTLEVCKERLRVVEQDLGRINDRLARVQNRIQDDLADEYPYEE